MTRRPLSWPVLLGAAWLLAGCSTVQGWFEDDKDEVTLSGDRIGVLAEDRTLSVSDALAEVKVELPPAVLPDQWPQAGGVASRFFPNVAATLAEDRASGTVGEGNEWPGALMAPPVVGKDAVYAMDAQGYISAHTRMNPGEVRWVSESVAMEKPSFGGGLAVGTELVYAVTAEGRIVALEAATGKPRWTRELLSPVRAAPRLGEDMLLVSTVDSQLFVLNPATGAIRWQHRGISEPASLLGSSVPAVSGPVVLVAYNSGELYALSKREGEAIWMDSLLIPLRTRASDTFTGISGDPVIAGGTTYSVSTNGLLAALDLRTGLRIWEQRLASGQTPWVTENFLFVLDTDNRLVALSRKDGQIKWIGQLTLEDEPDEDEVLPPLHGPYLVNGQLLVIDPAGYLILVDPADGKLIAQRDFVEGVTVSPAFADGGMYVLDQDAVLHFIK